MFEQFQPKTIFIGKNTHFLATCHSTNDIAMQMIQNTGVFEGQIVVTNFQTAGKGQRGNTWEAQAGQNLTFSLILKPTFLKPNEQFKINIAVSLGIHEFLESHLPTGLSIKWPNDIYFNDRKLGGVLIENSLQGEQIQFSIIGIGLNINQSTFADKKAISLLAINPNANDYKLDKLLEQLSECIEKYYLKLKANEFNQLKLRYLQKLFRFGAFYRYAQNEREFLGKIIGVENDGRLLMEVEGNIEKFDFKEIQFVF